MGQVWANWLTKFFTGLEGWVYGGLGWVLATQLAMDCEGAKLVLYCLFTG